MPEALHRHDATTDVDDPRDVTESSHDPLESDAVLSALSDNYARDVLELVSDERLPAREIATRLDLSRATAYRRLDKLETAGLVTSSMSYDPDGHHRQLYHATVDEVVFSIDSGRLVVTQSS